VGVQGLSPCAMAALVDTKFVQRPKVFDNDEQKWRDWKFQLLTFVDLIDPAYSETLAKAESSTAAVSVTDAQKAPARLLYALLASITCGRGLRVFQSIEDRNGFEAWRQLTLEFEPKVAQRRLGVLHGLLNPDFGRSEDDFRERWPNWEHELRSYESLAGKRSMKTSRWLCCCGRRPTR
jgi:hypothetical protein